MSDEDRTRTDGSFEVGVRFRHNPRVYSFAAVGMRLNIGDKVLVRTEKGVDLGEVMEIKGRISDERAKELMPVVRKATAEDLEHVTEQEERERRAMKICGEKIEEHGLPMKLIDAALSFDNTRLLFFFSADGRVDFRELVRDLARTFRVRIELRQIGVRDEAKLLGGLGPCGRRLCCKTFMKDFEPVGIRVAKDQGLALNPSKISGLCDRLMCCLLFEHEAYLESQKRLPERGDRVDTPHGPGRVREVAVLCEQVTVELEDGKEVRLSAQALHGGEEGRDCPAAGETASACCPAQGGEGCCARQKAEDGGDARPEGDEGERRGGRRGRRPRSRGRKRGGEEESRKKSSGGQSR